MMETLTTALSSCFELVTTTLTFITSNALLVVLLAGGTLAPLGFRMLRGMKRVAKH